MTALVQNCTRDINIIFVANPNCFFLLCELNRAMATHFNPLRTKMYLSNLKNKCVPRSKHSLLRLQKTDVNAVQSNNRCLFSDPHKTHKYSMGRAFNC